MATHESPTPLSSGHATPEVHPKVILDMLSEHWVEVVGADYAIMRRQDPSTGKLELVSFSGCSDARPIGESFTIPRYKDSSCNTTYVTDSWGAWSFPRGAWRSLSDAQRRDFSAGDAAFMDTVMQKAAFPICLGNQDNYVGILVGSRETPVYSLDTVVPWWLFAQLFISSRVAQGAHVGFLSSIEQLSNFSLPEVQLRQLEYITFSLASCAGLGWNRVWFLKQESDECSFTCQSCLGETTRERWLAGVATRQSQVSNLQEELAWLMAFETMTSDSLFRALQGQRFQIGIPGFSSYLKTRFEVALAQDRCPESICTVKLAKNRIAKAFVDQVNAFTHDSEEYLREDDVFWYPLSLGNGQQYLVFLSNPYESGDVQSQCLLSTIYLEAASLLMRQLASSEDLNLHAHEDTDDRSTSLLGVLESWSFVNSITPSEPKGFLELAEGLICIRDFLRGESSESAEDDILLDIERFCEEDSSS